MNRSQEDRSTALQGVANAMVKLHKEQFGRGPTSARANFAGPDVLVCMLRDVLLPAECKMVELGDQGRVRDTRVAFQAATESEFIAAVEDIVDRKVLAFASGVDPNNNVVFETFYLEPRESTRDGDGVLTTERTSELSDDI